MKRRNHEINDYAAVPGFELFPPKSIWPGLILLALKSLGVLAALGLVILLLCIGFGL